MTPMVWNPNDRDRSINQYLDTINHAPYITIFALLLSAFCGLTFLILVGGF